MQKRALCSGCDIYWQMTAEVPDSGDVGDVTVKALDLRPLRPKICMKGVRAPSGFAHSDRVLCPLRRRGPRAGRF